MSQLQFPLKDYLRDSVDEAALQRMAREIDVNLHGPRRRRARPLALAALAMLGGTAITLFALMHRDPGPLQLSDGQTLGVIEADSGTREIALSDGSTIRLSSGARIEPLESTGSLFAAMLTRGRADFDVRPRGPRRWFVECGLATVEVIGTAFVCERKPGRLRVAVTRGVVLLRGERVPDRIRRLVAGESLELSEAATGALGVGTRPPAAENPDRIVQRQPSSTTELKNRDGGNPPTRNSSATSWRDLAQRGRHGEAFAILGADGLRRESKRLGVNDLLALADVARLSGHPADAVAPLERILIDFASDAQAPLAAFALGRLELDSMGRPQQAATALNKALALGIPRSLREDVRARLVEAYARSGHTDAARRAATAYFDEFPHGHHTRAIEGWLGPQ
jgi:transmembrane sensor